MNRLKPKLYGHRVNRKKVIATKPEGGGGQFECENLSTRKLIHLRYPSSMRRYELMRASECFLARVESVTPFF